LNKREVVSYFNLNNTEVDQIEHFIKSIIDFNKHTNIIGKSTIENFWDRHVLDCLQLISFMKNKNSKIVDLGTGAGLPGVLFSIAGYQNVLMIESIKKKCDFVRKIIKELSLPAKIQNKRIETTKTYNKDIIVSRALAPLSKLLSYALMHSHKNSTLLFLKRRKVNKEIENAMKFFLFDIIKIKSLSVGDGCVIKIKNLKTKK